MSRRPRQPQAQADVIGALGLYGQVQTSVDGRVCDVPKQFWVAFHGSAGLTVGSSSTVTVGSVSALVRDDRCQLTIPIAAPPKGARWEHDSLLASAEPLGSSGCDQFIKALARVVEVLEAGRAS